MIDLLEELTSLVTALDGMRASGPMYYRIGFTFFTFAGAMVSVPLVWVLGTI